MKKFKSIFFTLALIILVVSIGIFTTNVTACIGCELDGYMYLDGYYYSVSNGMARIVYCNIDEEDVVIPSSLNGYPVVEISSSIFSLKVAYEEYDCDYAVKHLSIPYSVTSISDNAFEYCPNLTNITVDANNSAYSSQDGVLFNKEKTKLVCYPAGKTETSYIIPDSVTSIGDYAFRGSTRLTSINISESVTSIGGSAFANTAWYNNQPDGLVYAGKVAYKYKGTCSSSVIIKSGTVGIADYAFSSCSSLTSITIPDSVISIGDDAFYNCKSLTSVTIPNSVTSIGSSAFYNCSSLKSITIPDSVTSIGDYAFYSCDSLTSITIPNSVTSIGGSAFAHTAWYNNQPDGLVYAGKVAYKYKGACPNTVTIKDGTLEIASGAFYNCSKLTSITIPDSVTSIGDGAFRYCSSLTSITIGNSVTSIGDCAFYDCNSLTSITIPDSVISIGYEAFSYCSGLTSITLGNSVTSIGDRAFYSCSSLTSITIPDSVVSIGDYAFYDCTGLTSITIPDSVTSIGDGAFYDCNSLTSITIGNSVTSISNYAFYNCSKLTSITIGNSVTSIGYEAFYNCSSLTSITIPNSVTSIGDYAFENCTGLTSITLGNSVTSIGDDAFYNCSSLTSITIPDSVTSIGNRTFSGCDSLKSITIPDGVTSIGVSAFYGCSKLTSVYITDLAAWCGIDFYGSESNPLCLAKNLYLNNELVTNLIIPDGVTKIEGYAFYNCSSLTSITIPDGVTSIGYYAFENCTGLTSITIPDSVTSIGDDAFANTAWYNNHPDGLVYAGKFAYKYKGTCSSSVIIKSGTVGIADYAFSSCSSLTSITIPDSVTSIGYRAFSGCDSLTSITVSQGNTIYHSSGNCLIKTASKELVIGCKSSVIPSDGSVTSIGEDAFYYCDSLTSITIPDSVISIGDSAFYNCSKLTSVYITDIAAWCGIDFYGSSNPLCYAKNLYLNNELVTNLIIPDGVTKIEDYAFYNCSSLTSITIPNSVTSIGYLAFSGCTWLKNVYYCGTEEEWNDISIGNGNSYLTSATRYYHKYDNNCDKTCNICGDTRTVPAHKYTNDCDKTCNVCSAKRTIKHTYKLTATKKATLTANGKQEYKCTECGYITKNNSKVVNKVTSFKLSATSYTYDGKVKTPTVTVKDSKGNTLKKGTDYDVTYASGRKNVGTYSVKITMKGKYSGTKTLTFKIKPVDISKCEVVLSSTSYTYNGKTKLPSVSVLNYKGAKLLEGTHYTLSYSLGRKNVGSYKVTVKMKDNYTGTKAFTFKINPAKTTLSKVTPATKKLTVTYAKKTTQVTGYEVQYSTSKSFTTKTTKTKIVSKNSTTKATITGLKAKTTYYVRVRTYKTVGKTKYYSGWTTVKSAKTK